MRLIDADAIIFPCDTAPFFKTRRCDEDKEFLLYFAENSKLHEFISKQPTVDAVPLRPILDAMQGVLLVKNGEPMKNGEPAARPIKDTSKQDCYEALYKIQEYLGLRKLFLDIPLVGAYYEYVCGINGAPCNECKPNCDEKRLER